MAANNYTPKTAHLLLRADIYQLHLRYLVNNNFDPISAIAL
jgi:hypothetical protein